MFGDELFGDLFFDPRQRRADEMQEELKRLNAVEERVKRERAEAAREARSALILELARRRRSRLKVAEAEYDVFCAERGLLLDVVLDDLAEENLFGRLLTDEQRAKARKIAEALINL